jgi:hypothetical protein
MLYKSPIIFSVINESKVKIYIINNIRRNINKNPSPMALPLETHYTFGRSRLGLGRVGLY